MDYADRTIGHYQSSVPYYSHAFDSSHSRFLDGFLDALPAGAHVLELGCGTGRDASRMQERGFTVDATDGTPAMLRKASERYGIKARLMRFGELDAESTYDAVWAHACLFHVPLDQLGNILARILRALKPGGLSEASFKTGEDEGVDERGRYFALTPADRLEQLYRDQDFEVLDSREWQGKGADGAVRSWVSIRARKPAG
ncbi:class I SAM-dependent methyltransferase [Paraurantiacibacter namhicola]|uniref:Tellurite resistance protein TehB n=1 Tax=Paraurantiacibacter namhicola TaxID=645517 RepID=A0A1C7D882_9SPHN|nr:class I SAM-dependent methyltransferase [Paraurantiacibacter namhicola]ANU07684.1 tellurite resistance protein TehB [Paraurantiacibacter namhicola]